ncbi:MAG: ATP-binding protein [Pirellulales bacterium]
MALKIERGRRATPARVVIYGTEGIGKSTLAAAFPSAVILDTEEGTHHLDVARVSIGSWDDLRQAVAEIGTSREFKTVVIDSADWAERLLVESVLKDARKKSIEDFGYGKGWVIVAEQFGRFLSSCDALVGQGLNVVFVAHSKVQRTSPPDLADGFDRYELKLAKQTAPLLKEWADALLFCTYKVQTTEGSDGRTKGIGGKKRVMHTERAAAWDAKNRYGLGEELPMTIEALEPLFANAPARKPTIREQIAAATSVEQLGDIGDIVDDLEAEGRLTPEQAETARQMIADRHQQIEPAPAGEVAE